MQTTQSKDGTTLAYDIYGSGSALIYITGVSCFRSFMPVLQDAKVFAKEFTVYHYDRRGRGDSGNTLPYAIEREIEDIEALIDAAGGKAFLYGHSSGAVLALEAAMRLGKKVSKMIISDAAYAHNETEKAEYHRLSQSVQKLIQAGEYAKAMRGFLKGIGMPKIFIYLLPLMPGWKSMKALAPTLVYDIALTSDCLPLERLSQITTTVQIIVGEKSPASMHEVAKRLMKAIPKAKFAQLAGQDHMINPKVLLPVLSNFLKQG